MSYVVSLMKTVTNHKRLNILQYIYVQRETTVNNIHNRLKLEQPYVSIQLKKLFPLIKKRREGKSVYYSINQQHIQFIKFVLEMRLEYYKEESEKVKQSYLESGYIHCN